MAKETKTEYELVTRRVITEFEQFKSQKVVDMRDIMLNFVRMQVSGQLVVMLRDIIQKTINKKQKAENN